jgi:hypothetical protein
VLAFLYNFFWSQWISQQPLGFLLKKSYTTAGWKIWQRVKFGAAISVTDPGHYRPVTLSPNVLAA